MTSEELGLVYEDAGHSSQLRPHGDVECTGLDGDSPASFGMREAVQYLCDKWNTTAFLTEGPFGSNWMFTVSFEGTAARGGFAAIKLFPRQGKTGDSPGGRQ